MNPSNIDIENQSMQQNMYANHNNMPFAGLIVGPYSPNLTSADTVSEIRCFYIVQSAFKKPYDIIINVIPQSTINQAVYDQIA